MNFTASCPPDTTCDFRITPYTDPTLIVVSVIAAIMLTIALIV